MNHQILFKTFCFLFQRTNSFYKCFSKPVTNFDCFKCININFLLSKRSFIVSSQCFLKKKRRRAIEPIVLKVKSSKKPLQLYNDINLKYF